MEGRITANGVETAYRVDGPDDGPVVLLANSLLSNYGMWDPQIPALAERYRVLRYDQRGHGGSEATPPPYDFDMLAEDARALLDGIVGSRLVVLEGAAHFSNIEQPDAFNAALRGFLDEN